MGACEAAKHLELTVEYIVSMAAFQDSIIHNQLLHHFSCICASEGKILSEGIKYLAVILNSVLGSTAFSAFMLQ